MEGQGHVVCVTCYIGWP